MAIILATVLGNTLFFFLGGAALHVAFYLFRRNEAEQWKHQPKRFQTLEMLRDKVPLVLLNSMIINGALGVAFYIIANGYGKTYWELGDRSVFSVALSTAGLFLWYHVMLYYWHRTMHLPGLFKRFHHLHHKYKHPVWLDALYEHPLEAAWGAVVLISPLFVFPIWAYSYFIFAVVMGLHEILDHAGINLNLPILSSSKAHDEHHLRCRCYYGQLLPLLDFLHGTGDAWRERHKGARW